MPEYRLLQMACLLVILSCILCTPVAWGQIGKVVLRLPQAADDWRYDEDNKVSRIELKVPYPASTADQKTILEWKRRDGWKKGDQSISSLTIDVQQGKTIDCLFTVDYQFGVFSIRKSFQSQSKEWLLDMPFPDDVYVVVVNLHGLTWHQKLDRSKLDSVEVKLTSGAASCQFTAKPEEAFDGWEYPGPNSCLFEWQKSIATAPIIPSIYFRLVDGTRIPWPKNGKDLRVVNPGVTLSDKDWQQ